MSEESKANVSEEKSGTAATAVAMHIKIYREAAGLTQKELAEILGVATGTVQQWELGIKHPRHYNIAAIAKALDVPVARFYDDQDTALSNRNAIGNKIRAERRKAGLTQEQLANACGLAKITIQQYEAGKRLPRLSCLVAIAKALNIPALSIESLLQPEKEPLRKSSIGDQIKKERLRVGMTQKQLGEQCGIAEQTIRRYELGLLNPKFETLSKIAQPLGIPVFSFYNSQQPENAVSAEACVCAPANHEQLLSALREHAEWAEANIWECPITLCDDLSAAADLIENQQRQIEALLQANKGLQFNLAAAAERSTEPQIRDDLAYVRKFLEQATESLKRLEESQ